MKSTLTLFCALATAIPMAAIAEETQKELEVIAVVGEREPGNMLVDSDDLLKIQATTIEDIFANQSSVAVGGGSATAQKIYVRGFEDVMLNVTIDGAQSPGELYHHQGRVQLEPEFIKTIELDAGAGVATNGAGALTGALRATLKDAFDMLDNDKNVGALVKGTAKMNGEDGNKFTLAAYGRLSDEVGLIAGFTNEDRKDFEDGNGGLAEATPYKHKRAFAKLNAHFGDHDIFLTLEDVADEATTFERPNLTNFLGRYELSDQEMNRNTLSFNHQYDPASQYINLKTTVFTNTSDFRVQRLNSDIIYGEGEFDSIGFDLRNTALLGQHKVTVGIDYRADELTSAQNATPPFAWGDTEQSADVTGLYVQDNWKLSPSLDLTAGLRYDRYKFNGNGGVSNGIEISDSGLSPNIGLDWQITEGLILRAAYADAFRGVVIREAFFSGLYLHDGTLQSEQADNIELGFSYETGDVFVRGTLYEQNIENFIDIEYVGGDVWGYWRNVGDAKVEGYELEAGISTETIFASVGVWDAKNTLNGEPLIDTNMGLGTSIGRTWIAKFDVVESEALSLGSQIRYVESEPNLVAEGAPDKTSYWVAKVYANWSPIESTTIGFTINNLFDEFYYDHSTYTYYSARGTEAYAGYPSMGREMVASVTVKF